MARIFENRQVSATIAVAFGDDEGVVLVRPPETNGWTRVGSEVLDHPDLVARIGILVQEAASLIAAEPLLEIRLPQDQVLERRFAADGAIGANLMERARGVLPSITPLDPSVVQMDIAACENGQGALSAVASATLDEVHSVAKHWPGSVVRITSATWDPAFHDGPDFFAKTTTTISAPFAALTAVGGLAAAAAVALMLGLPWYQHKQQLDAIDRNIDPPNIAVTATGLASPPRSEGPKVASTPDEGASDVATIAPVAPPSGDALQTEGARPAAPAPYPQTMELAGADRAKGADTAVSSLTAPSVKPTGLDRAPPRKPEFAASVGIDDTPEFNERLKIAEAESLSTPAGLDAAPEDLADKGEPNVTRALRNPASPDAPEPSAVPGGQVAALSTPAGTQGRAEASAQVGAALPDPARQTAPTIAPPEGETSGTGGNTVLAVLGAPLVAMEPGLFEAAPKSSARSNAPEPLQMASLGATDKPRDSAGQPGLPSLLPRAPSMKLPGADPTEGVSQAPSGGVQIARLTNETDAIDAASPDAAPDEPDEPTGFAAQTSPFPKPRPVATVETVEGTGAEGEIPAPKPAVEETLQAAVSAPAPRKRPKVISRTSAEPRLAPARSTRSSTSSSVATAANRTSVGIDLDDLSLVGVFSGSGSPRALIRLPSGGFKHVTRGDQVDGWTVSSIKNNSLSLRRGGRTRRLALAIR